MTKAFICLTLLLCPHLSQAQAQKTTITGLVQDTAAAPLQGVSITAKHSRTSGVSGSLGQFSIRLTNLPDTLTVSYTGYQSQTRIINPKNPIIPQNPRSNNPVNPLINPNPGSDNVLIIILTPLPTTLADVTVSSGYQSFSRRNATGSYNNISNQLLNQRTTSNILDKLDGLSTALRFDKRPGAEAPIQVRGLSSLLPNTTDPLVIVDNFPYEGDLSNINSNDVENISILKDAAAAAIWGARAGNGVIVITTKTGRQNQPLSIGLTASLNTMPRPALFSIPIMSAAQTIEAETFLFNNGYYDADISNTTSFPALTPAVEILLAQRNGSISPAQAQQSLQLLAAYDNRHDISKYFYRQALSQQHAIRLSGGSRSTSYYLSAGLDDNRENLIGNSNRRITLKSDISTAITKKWQLSLGTLYSNTQARLNSPGGYNSFSHGTGKLPIYSRLADDQGNPLPISLLYRSSFTDTAGAGRLLPWTYSPLQELATADNGSTGSALTFNIGSRFTISNALNLEARLQYQANNAISTNYRSTHTFYTRNLINTYTQLTPAGTKYIIPNDGILQRSYTNAITKAARLQANYNKSFSSLHQLTALAAAEARETKTIGESYTTYGYNKNNSTATPVDYLSYYPSYNNIAGSLTIPWQDAFRQSVFRFVSILTNMNYTYRNRYTLSLSARKDASNIFGVTANQKGTPLWSAGALWKISDEPFYSNKKWPTLSLRASYGFSGSFSPDVSAHTILQYFQPSFSIINIPSAAIQTGPNPGLRWQKVGTLNLGLNFATASSRLSGSIEWYNKNTRDLLYAQSIDPTTGTTSITSNSADLSGNGWDIEFNSKNLLGKLKWNTAFLFSYTTSKITKLLRETTDNAANYISHGKSITPKLGLKPFSILAYRWGGLSSQGLPQGYLNDTLSTNYQALRNAPSGSLIVKGQGIPPYFGAIRNEFSFRNWQLSFSLSYKLGYWFIKDALSYTALYDQLQGHPDFANRWQKHGDELTTTVPAMRYPLVSGMDAFYQYAEVNVLPAGQVRFEWLSLSYELSKNRIKKMPVQNAKLFLNISNLNWLIWKANKQDLDPDYQYSPRPPKSIAFGCNINF